MDNFIFLDFPVDNRPFVKKLSPGFFISPGMAGLKEQKAPFHALFFLG
jgi:hypothetical protein